MPTKTINTSALYAQAWNEGEVEVYVRAYLQVHETLRAMRNTNLLTQVVNSQLRKMERDGLSAVEAARSILPELQADGSRLMVMAATVDILCNAYKPGTEVSRLKLPTEVLG